jgi:hypothetical protein
MASCAFFSVLIGFFLEPKWLDWQIAFNNYANQPFMAHKEW